MDLAALTAAEREACGPDPGALCLMVYRATKSDVLATGADVLLQKPLKIILIIVMAVVLRALLHRAITRVVSRTALGLPSALRERAPSMLDVSPLVAERRRQRAETIGSVLRSIASFVVLTIAFVMVLGEMGVNLAPIIASAGIVGVAVGFGAQNLVRDFLTGIFMILEDQYGVGDAIDAGPASGVVEAVGLRSTRLRDVHGTVWHIRNGEITRVGNMSQQWARALLDVSVAYNADVDRAREVILQVANDLWHDPDYEGVVLEEPEVWGVEQLTSEGFTLRLVVKTAPQKQWMAGRVLRERIKAAFEAEGIPVPLSTMVRETPAPSDMTPEPAKATPAAATATAVKAPAKAPAKATSARSRKAPAKTASRRK